jgi:hypothetical protein
VHHYQHESKCALMEWKHPSSPSTQKSKVTQSAGQVMLTVFWDSQRVLLAHFEKRGENVNSASYCEALGCNSQKTSRPTGRRDTASS